MIYIYLYVYMVYGILSEFYKQKLFLYIVGMRNGLDNICMDFRGESLRIVGYQRIYI